MLFLLGHILAVTRFAHLGRGIDVLLGQIKVSLSIDQTWLEQKKKQMATSIDSLNRSIRRLATSKKSPNPGQMQLQDSDSGSDPNTNSFTLGSMDALFLTATATQQGTPSQSTDHYQNPSLDVNAKKTPKPRQNVHAQHVADFIDKLVHREAITKSSTNILDELMGTLNAHENSFVNKYGKGLILLCALEKKGKLSPQQTDIARVKHPQFSELHSAMYPQTETNQDSMLEDLYGKQPESDHSNPLHEKVWFIDMMW